MPKAITHAAKGFFAVYKSYFSHSLSSDLGYDSPRISQEKLFRKPVVHKKNKIAQSQSLDNILDKVT